MNESYKSAGVDVNAGYEAVRLMREHVTKTYTDGVIGDIGGFGGLFAPNLTGISSPVLVSGTDGVGTKLKLAFEMDKHDTVGIDCVAMCVNDIICSGAAPLLFLDYLAVGKNEPARIAEIVKGVSNGCIQAGAALVGGETAEMPGFYPAGEYDLAGFSVGIVDKEKIIDGTARIKAGDAIIALPSSGVHSNGFSLVRKVFKVNREILMQRIDELSATLGETLLTPTRIYVKPLLALAKEMEIHGVCHITGGGFYENMPRMLPKNVNAVIELKKLQTPPIFSVIERTGGIPKRDMFNTFNMGVGMMIAVAADNADEAVKKLAGFGENAYILGSVTAGSGEVELV